MANTAALNSTKTKAQEALEVLEQAWAYYTPTPRPAPAGPAYEDIPLAA
ncbi:hypothetical protein TRP8649_01243 [Pelagimonas phthalicica]|uniref:Uncharacterized protein n=1 Tax=Pelagimonas phthalicica TaxID=1037362 RepID=A0A238J8V5_9RHOB|nr:hypothetical protein [Pelagimonas phthalicica]TDS94332.1 hypothetical protein CLV87_0829 [Pelagimonas phthalicica]SMX27141.1 hypothetical protein TRP8649_01243 [Pelagimonas phthalicica]